MFIFAIGPHALAILHRMTARTAFPFAGRSRPNPSGELESQQVLFGKLERYIEDVGLGEHF